MITEITKTEAEANLPSYYRAQHDEFEIGGEERGGMPVARVKAAQTYLELAYRMELIDDGQYGHALHFAAMREMFLLRTSPKGTILGQLAAEEGEASVRYEDRMALADQYYALMRSKMVGIAQQKLLEKLCHEILSGEQHARLELADIGSARFGFAFDQLKNFYEAIK